MINKQRKTELAHHRTSSLGKATTKLVTDGEVGAKNAHILLVWPLFHRMDVYVLLEYFKLCT